MKLEAVSLNCFIPHDEAPSELTLLPGEKQRMQGWIEIENASPEDLQVQIRFDLAHGYILSVKGIEQQVKIHGSYKIIFINEVWTLAEAQESV